MEVLQKKMAVIQVLSTFLILLTSPCLAARQIEHRDGPSPAPAESGTDAQILCNRASRLAIQGLRNMSDELLDLKAQPSKNFSASFIQEIDECLHSSGIAQHMIQRAIKEGPHRSPDYYYSANMYDEAIDQMGSCNIRDPVNNPGYDVACDLIIEANELCF